MPPTTAPRTYTKNQLAELLQVAPMTVYRMSQDGRLPKPIKALGKSLRWLAKDVHGKLGISE